MCAEHSTPVTLDRTIAVSVDELNQWGCPSCGYRSGHTPMGGPGTAIWQCGDCGYGCVILAQGVTKSSIGLGSGEKTIYPELEDHPRRGTPKHGRPDRRPENGGEFFRSRGIGLDRTPGCMVCGGANNLYNNIAAFAQCRDS